VAVYGEACLTIVEPAQNDISPPEDPHP